MAGAPLLRELPAIQVLLRAQTKQTQKWKRDMADLDVAEQADFIATHRDTLDMRFHSQMIVGLSEALRFQSKNLLKEAEITCKAILEVTAPGIWDPIQVKEKPNKQTTKPRTSFEGPPIIDPSSFLEIEMEEFDISDIVEHNRANLDRITLRDEDDGFIPSHFLPKDTADNVMIDMDMMERILLDWSSQSRSQDPNQLEAQTMSPRQALALEQARRHTQEMYGSFERARPESHAASRTSRAPPVHEFSGEEVSLLLKELLSSGPRERIEIDQNMADKTLGDYEMEHDGIATTDRTVIAADGTVMTADEATIVVDELAIRTEGGPHEMEHDGQLARVSTADTRFGGLSSIRGISDATFADRLEDDRFISLLPPVAESTRTAPDSPRRRRRRRHRRFMDVARQIPNSVFLAQTGNTQVHTERMVYGPLITRARPADPITSPRIRKARSEVQFQPPVYCAVPPTELFKMETRRHLATFIKDRMKKLVPKEYNSSSMQRMSEIHPIPQETQIEIHPVPQVIQAEIHPVPRGIQPVFPQQEQHPGTGQNLELPGGGVPNVTGVSGLTGSSVGFRQKDASNSTGLHPISARQLAFETHSTPSFPISLGGSLTDFQAGGIGAPDVPAGPSLISVYEQRTESCLLELEGHTDSAVYKIKDQIRKRKVVDILLSALDDLDSQMMFSDVVKEYGNEQERPELSYILLLLHSLNFVTLEQAVDYEEVVIKIHRTLRQYNAEECNL